MIPMLIIESSLKWSDSDDPQFTESQRQTGPARWVYIVCSVQTERLLTGASQYWTLRTKLKTERVLDKE